MNEPTETIITTGKVKAISIKPQGKYSVCLLGTDGEHWYSSFGTPKFAKGDTIKIEFQFSEDNKWRNAIRIDVIEKAPLPEAKSTSNFTSVSQDNARITMRESYIKDIVVAILTAKGRDITLEDATTTAITCFGKIVDAVKEYK